MSRLQLIEQKLLAINSAEFQNLCDAYLTRRTQEIRSLNRTGSQLGKQKTVKGTPDTFFRLEDDRLQFVEFTTQADNVVKKIKEDLDKCIDESKIGIPKNEVDKVIFCFNSRLTLEEETELVQYACDNGIDVDLLGIDNLAMEINSKHLILARDFLDIPLDTGQILSLDNFVNEYNNKAGGLATPLDNTFFHREVELSDISNRLGKADLLIISGAPGVGKTKIALEAITQFLESHPSYEAFAVSKKDVDISADLRLHLDNNRDYLLLVDDANRQLINFKQILGVFRENREGNIKLAVTVREYAMCDILNECADYRHEVIEIGRFTDDEIKEIIASDAFGIKHHKYQEKIIEIADGNARLAIMGAKLAIEKQQEFLYGSVYELYDSYFQTFVRDNDIFKDDTVLKTLGLISFFFTINRGNKKFIQELLADFGLDYYKFNEAINELEKRELLEIKYDHVRVSEQVMATYYFYKVFIKDKILSFKALLFKYFSGWERRFKDTVIPANNTFGYKEVHDSISEDLNEYLASLTDDKKLYEFFSMFWFYKPDEMLAFLHGKVKVIPEQTASEYQTDYIEKDYIFEKDQILSYLARLFLHRTEHFTPALALGFEYARKSPINLPLLVKTLRENISFSHDDEYVSFLRQIDLFSHVIENLSHEHYRKAFIALATTFLAHHYQVHGSTRGNKITFYDYSLPATETIKQLRINIWESLFTLFDDCPDDVIAVVDSFTHIRMKPLVPELLEIDLECILPFITDKLDTDSFRDIHFVQEFIKRAKSDKYKEQLKSLKAKFRSADYLAYRKLDWNYFRGKQEYDFDNRKDFERLKTEDIKKSFLFKSPNEFDVLHRAIRNYLSIEKGGQWSLQKSIDIILEENFINNEEIGYLLLQSYLDNYPQINYTPIGLFNAIISKSEHHAQRLWKMLHQWDNKEKPYWQIRFIYRAPKEYLHDEHLSTLKNIINESQERFILYLDSLEGYFVDHQKEFFEIMELVVNKNVISENKISLGYDFFEKYASYFKGNEKLLATIYMQQEKCQHHHDYDGKDFKMVVDMYPPVLLEFVEEFYTKDTHHQREDTERKLGFVWDMENGSTIIEKAFDMIIEKNGYVGILDYPLVVFFKGMSPAQKEKALNFILEYITKNNTDGHRMNALFNTFHDAKIDFFEPALLHYLSLNTDVKQFEEIDWVANPGVISGEQSFGEIEASGWENVLNIVKRHQNKLDLIPIKVYIKKKIQYSYQRAEEERKRKYIDPTNWA